MKTMTCQQLGGACEKPFTSETFDEIAEKSQKHGAEMLRKGDQAHIEAMNAMRERMKSPEATRIWFESKRKEFEAMPDS